MDHDFAWLESSVEKLEATAKQLRLKITWTPNSPASDSEIVNCEQIIGLALPTSFQTFLRIANGASLAFKVRFEDGYDEGGCTLSVLSTAEIASLTQDYKTHFNSRALDNRPYCRWGQLIIFANCEDGNYCILTPKAQRGKSIPFDTSIAKQSQMFGARNVSPIHSKSG